MQKILLFPTCPKFYLGLRLEFVKCWRQARKNLPQALTFFSILEFFYEGTDIIYMLSLLYYSY